MDLKDPKVIGGIIAVIAVIVVVLLALGKI